MKFQMGDREISAEGIGRTPGCASRRRLQRPRLFRCATLEKIWSISATASTTALAYSTPRLIRREPCREDNELSTSARAGLHRFGPKRTTSGW
jgi:hypothetical protein